jgi:hypothetical protein
VQFSDEVLPHSWEYERPVLVFQFPVFSVVPKHVLVIAVADVGFVLTGPEEIQPLQRQESVFASRHPQ